MYHRSESVFSQDVVLIDCQAKLFKNNSLELSFSPLDCLTVHDAVDIGFTVWCKRSASGLQFLPSDFCAAAYPMNS